VRCALLGAFAFPHFQGSQVYVETLAHALIREGLEISVLSYGGERSLDLECHAIAPRWRPRNPRSGPKWRKPLADLALARKLLDLHRENPFDVILAHNAEAAAVALAVRPAIKTPVIYAAHTVLRWELSCYGPAMAGPPIDALGGQIDRLLARYADALVVLCEDARAELAPHARGPVALLPPALDPSPAPSDESRFRACTRAGVVPGAFSLYAGNLDPYQDLPRLGQAAKLLGDAEHPILVASHDPRGLPEKFGSALRFFEVSNFEEMRALTFAAGELVATRNRPGGFPVKLLNYMESGRPILAHEGIADGLEHARNAWLLPRHADARALADSLRWLRLHPETASRLGAEGRVHLERRHASAPLARAFANLFVDAVDGRRSPGLPVEAG